MPSTLPPKKEVMLAFLEKTSVFIHLDPRHAEVVVPPWFKKQPQLALQVGLNMPVPIRDLSVDDECVCCTLSFNRSPFFCWIPWTAIFALVGEDRRGMVWPDDVPPEVAAQAQQMAKNAGPRGAGSPPPRRAHLRAVGDAADVEAPSAPCEGATAPEAPAPEADAAPPPGDVAPAPVREDGVADSLADGPAPVDAPPVAADTQGESGSGAERKPRPAWLRVVK